MLPHLRTPNQNVLLKSCIDLSVKLNKQKAESRVNPEKAKAKQQVKSEKKIILIKNSHHGRPSLICPP